MRWKWLVAVCALLFGSLSARADGCKFRTDGRKVPEREQRAFVEWADGTETLHVAALGDPTAEGVVWVVPVRAEAAAVRAEPVDAFPAVAYYETLRARAERQLRLAIGVAAMSDSGGVCCPFAVGGCGGGAPKSAVEVSRIDKLGMVVTVVSADSRAGLEQYLSGQGVNSAAADLSSLEPYFAQPGHAFVCGWVAKRDQPVTATALKVVFPSPSLWFPLRATRAYTEPVETVVYVRGFVKPARGCELPELKCQYIFGGVETRGVGQVFAADRFATDWPEFWPGYYRGQLEPLTRVTLTTDPQKWDRDLELVPGTTPVGTAALAVTGWVGFLGPLWSALLGAALGLLIPWLTVAKAERRRGDWLAGAITGAAIVLTIWGSAVVFSIWRWYRFRDRPNKPRRFVILPALAIVHFALVVAVCKGLFAWINANA